MYTVRTKNVVYTVRNKNGVYWERTKNGLDGIRTMTVLCKNGTMSSTQWIPWYDKVAKSQLFL